MSSGTPASLGGPPRNTSVPYMLAMLVGIGVVLYVVYLLSPNQEAFFAPKQTPGSPAAVQPSPTAPGASQATPPPTEVDTQAAVRALADVKLAQARERMSQLQAQLERLKQHQAQWQSRSATLLGGEPGRRIAGSAAHLNVAVELFERELATPVELVSWEQQLKALAAPLETASARIDVTPEFTRALDDLGRQLTETSALVERRLQLVEALTQETRTLPPAEQTLEETLRNRQAQLVRAEAERLAAVREKARREAEEENAKRVAAVEKELVAAEAKRQEEKIRAEKERITQLTETEKAHAAEEAKVRAVQARAIQEGLKAEATRVEQAIKDAQLEREFERDLTDIKSYLSPFITEGFGRRKSGKGPMSLGYLKSKGALDESQNGIKDLHLQATGTNDRPLGSFPSSFSVNDLPRINKAADLLRKYGELMVKKGMLDE